MHPSALRTAQLFFQTYAKSFSSGIVLDIGAQDVNGCLREVAPPGLTYVGVDFVAGRNVDVQLADPYRLPFEDESVDVVVSSSCFEHSEMFWLLFLEVLRVLRPQGLFYLNAPSNGHFHRWPVDCWRFYPDSGEALVTWARYNQLRPLLLESFIGKKYMGLWNDFVAVYVKDERYGALYADRITEHTTNYLNARVAGVREVLAFQQESPDQSGMLSRLLRRFWQSSERATMERIKARPKP